MKKRELKKLQLHRETLKHLEMVKGGVKQGGIAGGTHYESICLDLCQPATGGGA